jgi:6-phosphogluconolactonase
MNMTLIIPGDREATLLHAAEHFITLCRDAIQDHDIFTVALSGGSTPSAIYELICSHPHCEEIEWEKVHLFWSDERSVPPDHPDNNYQMAMKAGFSKMPIPPRHIHRMVAETDIEKNSLAYEKKIREVLDDRSFDLVMLGMGEDGHTASLFPGTAALKTKGRLVVANFVPQKNSWRMTLTFDCINNAHCVVFYVLGAAKKEMLTRVCTAPPTLPCQMVGNIDNPAIWIMDEEAAPHLS